MKFLLNKVEVSSVLLSVRMMIVIMGGCFGLLLASCSSSRTIGMEQELPVGTHVAKTVIDSDFYIPSGSSMVVDYSRAARYFVASGGALSGFPKGAELTTIYAEKGALIPNASGQVGVRVETVKDAVKTYRERHKELPPVGMQTGVVGGRVVSPVVVVGGGFWGGWGPRWGRSRGWGSGGGRAVSVRPSSYRKKN